MTLSQIFARIPPPGYIKRFILAARDIVEKLPLAEAGVSDDGLPFGSWRTERCSMITRPKGTLGGLIVF